ncbi:mechanosensitive ion channel protein 10 [Neltuma alba]|uniref:mechanosensitive ion channel protein 10 n=1 Tax=Neltuma alba TaxID=207710 RepID=UPI0010A442E0|nr:mechanosensitive ion channel protein 10-like [Prosopis alba]
MDAKYRASKGGEVSMTEKKTTNEGEVVVTIPGRQNPNLSGESPSSKVTESKNTSTEYAANRHASLKSPALNHASPEIRSSSSPDKSPEVSATIRNLVRRKSLQRSVYSKPKSRFVEQPYPADAAVLEENVPSTLQEQLAFSSSYRQSVNEASPNNKSTAVNRTVSISSVTPETALRASSGPAGEDEDEIVYKKVELSKGKRKKVKVKAVIECIMLAFITGFLMASLSVENMKNVTIWGLEFWKWCVLLMVTFCGLLITRWFMHIIVFLIEMNFLLRKEVLYFVHGLKKSVQVFIWLGLILLAWVLLINHGVQRSELCTKILNGVTWTLVSLLIGSFLWMVKTLLLKILASNFHVKSFFDRIQVSIFHQYVLQSLSGPPLIEEAEKDGRSPTAGQVSFRSTKGEKRTKKEVINMATFHKMKREKVSAWTMKILVDAVANSRLSTISNVKDESFDDGGQEQTDKEITNEMEATAAAYKIFRNVSAPGCSYIDEDDLLRFMIKEEVDLIFPLFEGSDSGRIDRKALTKWVVKVYQERKALAHALSDTKTAVKQLNKLVTGVLVILIIILWLILVGIATTKVLVFISSQLVFATFMFGNTCKNIFEAIVFVFVMHPFDVGDRCVVDGVQLLVEEMNILTTVFLKPDNEKVFYPNSVLATKPISNYYRSPDMGDAIEFSIDFMTPLERIGALKGKIKRYLERNPHHWHANHTVMVKQIENLNTIKMALYVSHTMNFQDYGEKNRRIAELVMELKKIFEELDMRYNLLPQAVHVSYVGSVTGPLK